MNKIFTITTGRCGIHYLSAVIENCTKIKRTLQENEMNDPFSRKCDSEFERKVLVDEIFKEMKNDQVIISLYPKNGFLRHIKQKKGRFIYLYRKARDCAISWLKMDGIPGKSIRGQTYHPDITSKNNCLVVKDLDKLTDYQRCIWLCWETKERVHRMLDEHANIFPIDIYDLNKVENIERMLRWINVEYDLNDLSRIMNNRFIRNSTEDMSYNFQGGNIEYVDSLMDDQMNKEEIRLGANLEINKGYVEI